MTELLSVERDFWKKNAKELTKNYPNKFLLIKGAKVHGDYSTHDEAVTAGVEMFAAGPFWVCSVEKPEPDPLNIPSLVVGVPLVANP